MAKRKLSQELSSDIRQMVEAISNDDNYRARNRIESIVDRIGEHIEQRFKEEIAEMREEVKKYVADQLEENNELNRRKQGR